jgi:hypothetical protein
MPRRLIGYTDQIPFDDGQLVTQDHDFELFFWVGLATDLDQLDEG